MSDRKQQLSESRDFWQESAKHDKRQALASFAVAACGVSAATVGALASIEGEPIIGVPAIVVGAGLLISGYRQARSEIESAMDVQGLVAIRQHELDKLEPSQDAP